MLINTCLNDSAVTFCMDELLSDAFSIQNGLNQLLSTLL